jgi:hypothetical protein
MMKIQNHSNDALAPRDVRRYPTELEHVPSRSGTSNMEVERKSGYSALVTTIASGTNTTNEPGSPTAVPAPTKPFTLWEKGAFGFGDFLDVINPLHHIPIVATIYRNLSDDQIAAGPRVIGGAIWGRVGGLVAGVVNAVVEWWSGKDIGDHVYAAIFGGPKKPDDGTMVAQQDSAEEVKKRSAVSTGKAGLFPTAIVPGQTAEVAAAGSSAADAIAVPGIVPSSMRAALSSYERNRQRRETGEFLRVRFPA